MRRDPLSLPNIARPRQLKSGGAPFSPFAADEMLISSCVVQILRVQYEHLGRRGDRIQSSVTEELIIGHTTLDISSYREFITYRLHSYNEEISQIRGF
jgi:hypothetical protein